MEKAEESDEEQDSHTNANMSIGGPIALWIGLFAIAAIVQIFIFPSVAGTIVSPTVSYLNRIAAYALYIPGIFVLPILAALWIGSKAGSTTGKLDAIAYRAVINAVYACVIYMIEVFVFYIISGSTHTSALSAVPFVAFIEFVVAMPVLICLIIAPLFAMVSSARRF
jgi:hypothetical protein